MVKALRKNTIREYEEVLKVSRKSLKKFRTKPKPVVHIYTFAVVWVLIIIFTNVSANVLGFAILTILSLAASISVYLLVREKRDLELEEMLKSDFMKSGDGEAQEVLEALEQLEQVRASTYSLQNKKVFKKSTEIIQVSREILNRVTKKPELIGSVRRFFSHHLPTTVKLVDDYIEMENQSIKGENILGSMKKIEHALEMLDDALKKQLDSLFSHSMMDLESDVDVLENILKTDGLINEDSMSSFEENSFEENSFEKNSFEENSLEENSFVEKENEQE